MPRGSGNAVPSRLGKVSWWRNGKFVLLFLAPWLIGFFVFSIYPILYSLYLSFTNFNLFEAPDLVGFSNYTLLFSGPRFIKACKVTLKYVLLGVPLQLIFALALALLLNKGIPGLKYFRAIYYLPALLGGSVAISILWRQIFGLDGLVNSFLSMLGAPESLTGISWVSNPEYSLYTLILLRVWQFGSPMIIFLAGLKQIPAELYESASIDGAGKVRQFFRITLPMLSPILQFNLIMQIINAFQAFTPAYVIAGVGQPGGNLDSLLLYTIYLYTMGFQNFRMGVASAMAWVMLLGIAVITVAIFALSNRFVHYADD